MGDGATGMDGAVVIEGPRDFSRQALRYPALGFAVEVLGGYVVHTIVDLMVEEFLDVVGGEMFAVH
jgi:hypothetical protein